MWLCKHKWEVLSETKTESYAERCKAIMGVCPKPLNSLGLETLFGRQLVQILTCTKCGKIVRFVTEI